MSTISWKVPYCRYVHVFLITNQVQVLYKHCLSTKKTLHSPQRNEVTPLGMAIVANTPTEPMRKHSGWCFLRPAIADQSEQGLGLSGEGGALKRPRVNRGAAAMDIMRKTMCTLNIKAYKHENKNLRFDIPKQKSYNTEKICKSSHLRTCYHVKTLRFSISYDVKETTVNENLFCFCTALTGSGAPMDVNRDAPS